MKEELKDFENILESAKDLLNKLIESQEEKLKILTSNTDEKIKIIQAIDSLNKKKKIK